MAVRHVLPALVAAGALTLSGCGDGDAAAPVAATPVTSPAAAAQPDAAVAGASGAAGSADSSAEKAKGATSAATVAPEVVLPTQTDPVAQASVGGWQGATLVSLRRLDARLVVDEKATLRRVRSACEAFSTGLFQAKAVELVRTKFSTESLRLTQDQAELVYQVLLREACYPMSAGDAA